MSLSENQKSRLPLLTNSCGEPKKINVIARDGYRIDAKFSQDLGSGKRFASCACAATFEKKLIRPANRYDISRYRLAHTIRTPPALARGSRRYLGLPRMLGDLAIRNRYNKPVRDVLTMTKIRRAPGPDGEAQAVRTVASHKVY